MAKQPLISVIIPAYNTADTIVESIDSVLAQTYKHYEIIVVDDESPDNVASVVTKRYGTKVTLLRQKNTGLAGARNTGINQAKGEYVAFLDSDDVWLPAKLELQAKQIAEHPDGDIFYTNCFFWKDGKKTGQWTDIHGQKDGQIASQLIERTVMLPVLTVVAKTATVRERGLFDEALRQVEDYDMWLRVATHGGRFYGLPEPLALYRINPDGLFQNTLLIAQTQLTVLQKLQRSAEARYQPAIRRQITIFKLEVLHQRRKVAINRNQRGAAVATTLNMIPLRPQKTLQLLATTLILALQPSLLKRKLG